LAPVKLKILEIKKRDKCPSCGVPDGTGVMIEEKPCPVVN